MAMDAQTRAAFREMSRKLVDLSGEVKRLQRGARTSQLGSSSLQGKTINVYDESGEELRQTIGIQPDGTAGVVNHQGPPPPAPTAPTLTPGPLSLTVEWNGSLSDSTPADFDHIEVRVSEAPGDGGRLAGTLNQAGSLVVQPLVDVPQYVHFVAVSRSGQRSSPGPDASETPGAAVPPDSITETEILDGSITTPKLAANSVTAGNLEAILALVTMIVAGQLSGAHVEISETGITVYDENGNVTVSISSEDGSFLTVGSYETSVDGSSWSVGADGIWAPPGTALDDSPIGNPASQIAWQVDGDIRAMIEARVNDALLLKSRGDIVLVPGAGHSVVAQKPFLAMELSRGATYPINNGETVLLKWDVVRGSTGGVSLVDSNTYFKIPRDGVYRLEAGAAFERADSPANNSHYFASITDRISGERLTSQVYPANMKGRFTFGRTLELSAGAELGMRVYQNSGEAIGLIHDPNVEAEMAPAWMSVEYIGPPSTTEDVGDVKILVVNPIETDSYQYGGLNAWRSGDDVYMGDGGNGNHRGCFFYGEDAFAELEGKVIDRVTMYVRRSAAEGKKTKIRPYLRGHTFATNPRPSAPNMGAHESDYPDYGLIGNGFNKGQFANVDLPAQVAYDLAGGVFKGLMFEDSGPGRFGRFSRWTGQDDTANGTLTIIYHEDNA